MKQIERIDEKRTFISHFNEVVEIPDGLGTITSTPAGDKQVRFDNSDPIQVAAVKVFFDRMILNGYQPYKVTLGKTKHQPQRNTLLSEFDVLVECINFAAMKVFIG